MYTRIDPGNNWHWILGSRRCEWNRYRNISSYEAGAWILFWNSIVLWSSSHPGRNFRIRERTFHHRLTEPKQFGNTVLTNSEDEIGKLIEEMLLAYMSEGKPVILAGFGFYTELHWISHTCPFLATRFSAWIDIQDVASQQFGMSRQIGLTDTLKALQIKDWRSRFNRHYAANDAIRCLAVLSGLTQRVSQQRMGAIFLLYIQHRFLCLNSSRSMTWRLPGLTVRKIKWDGMA